MPLSDNNKNRGAHGDSSFMLGGVPSSSENPPDLSVGSVKEYNCPNCGAPIGFTEKCEYCGTRIEWRPYVIHLAPRLYYHKTYDAYVIGMVKKGALGTENPFAMELAHRELFERLANQMRQNVKVVEEDRGDAVFLSASISYADKNEREEK